MLENMISLYKVFTAPSEYSTTLIDPARYLDRQNIVATKVFARVVVVNWEGKGKFKRSRQPLFFIFFLFGGQPASKSSPAHTC